MEYVRCPHCGRVSQKRLEPLTTSLVGETSPWIVNHGNTVTDEEAVAAVLSEKTTSVTCDTCQRKSGKDINYVLEYTVVKPADFVNVAFEIGKKPR